MFIIIIYLFFFLFFLLYFLFLCTTTTLTTASQLHTRINCKIESSLADMIYHKNRKNKYINKNLPHKNKIHKNKIINKQK